MDEKLKALWKSVAKTTEKQKNIKALEASMLFDRAFYAFQYGVPESEAAAHFAKKENRENSPSAVFSSKHYYAVYPDVREAEMNPLLHYLRHGRKEGRIYRSENDCELYDYYFTQTLFDMEYYAGAYMTGQEQRMINPIEHYSSIGWQKGFLPNPHFDLEAFWQKYPDCKIAPLLYCLKYRVPEFLFTVPLEKTKLGYRADEYRSYIHMLRQEHALGQLYPNAESCEKLVWFWTTEQDTISGGLMSICGLYEIARGLVSIHGSEVVASTLPWNKGYLSGYTMFDNAMPVLRYDQITYHFPNVKEVLIMLPELHVREAIGYLSSQIDPYLFSIPHRSLNIMNQNIELMPAPHEVDRLKRYFIKVTQSTAHKSYTTQRVRDRYGIPTHQIIPYIKKEIVVTSYEQKEELFIYSPDEHPGKAAVLRRLREEFPAMEFIEIRDIPFREYLQLISRAKWAMTFGEGLDGYFLEPYAAGGVSFAVWNDAFFTDKYRALPTILGSYEEAAGTLPALMRSLDEKNAYEAARAQTTGVIYSDYSPGRTPRDTMVDFFLGNYDFP